MKKIVVLIGLSTIVWLSACQSHIENHESVYKFSVTSPLKKDTVTTREYVCQIHAIQHIELRALERGYIEKIYVDEGQFVKKGQLMFQIMPRLYEAELNKAKAEADFVRIEYENTKQLADKNVVAPNELALAKAKLDKANAELALEQVHLDFTRVRAPFDGIMNHFHVRLGSLVEEGELLSTLSDNSEMWVYFNVPEAEYLNYRSKIKESNVAKARLLMANNQIFNHKGTVTTIQADFNHETGNIAYRATFPNPEGLLRHGETGNILIDTPLPDALLIPQKATFEVLDKKYVFVLDKDNTLRSKEIKTGAELTHLYEVTSGLKETDKILLEGLRKVKEGQKIEFEFLNPEEAISELHELHAE